MCKRLNLFIKLGFLFSMSVLLILWNKPGIPAPNSFAYPNKFIELNKAHAEFMNNLFPAKTHRQSDTPELYIDPTLKQGLNLILPANVQKNLTLDTGYDRWEGLPTLSGDYLFLLKSWSDKSLFFSPRVSLTGSREGFSMTGGFRQLLTAETMLGFYGFHDWVRPRRTKGEYLKEAGVGMEFSALPGHYSDLTVSLNAYFPINERRMLKNEGNVLVREMLPTGADAKIGLQLPAVTQYLDMRLDGEVHSYRAESTNLTGYRAGFTVRTRNGMLSAVAETSKDSRFGENHKVEGNISLAFDWVDLLDGKNPFSAPYKPSDMRYSRNMRDSLYGRVTRKHDLPAGKSESKTILMAEVRDNTVHFNGGFPHLSNAWVTVQTSQSPWEDCMDVLTDSSGSYTGKLDLLPGAYRIRLIHKPTGRISDVKTVTIEEKKPEQEIIR